MLRPTSAHEVVHTGQVAIRRPGHPWPGHPRPALTLGDVLDVCAGLTAAALLALVYGNGAGPPRLLLALCFTFFVPGRAIVANWPRMARWSEAVTSMVVSLAVLTFLAMVVLWARVWHPTELFEAEAWLSLAGLGVGAARRHRQELSVAFRQVRPWPRGKDEGVPSPRAPETDGEGLENVRPDGRGSSFQDSGESTRMAEETCARKTGEEYGG